VSKVTGHNPLTPEQIELMNKVKAKGNELGELIDELMALDDTDKRSVATGKTNIQTGLMWLVRSVAKPSTFS